MRWLMRINPLSYGQAGLQRAIYWAQPALTAVLPGWGTILAVSGIFAAAMFLLSAVVAGGRVSADLQ